MNKPHIVIIQEPDGSIREFPLKPFLRQHLSILPAGIHPDQSSSHELRRILKNLGWELKIGPNRVLIVKPNDSGGTNFVDELVEDDQEIADEQTEIDAEEITFGLERDLQRALRANIQQLEKGLKITDGGSERSTEAGRIDITAEDESGQIVVIELKAGTAAPAVVAQILSYMGTVGPADGNRVRGILVAGDFDKRVIQAARVVPNLILKKYSFLFSFEAVT